MPWGRTYPTRVAASASAIRAKSPIPSTSPRAWGSTPADVSPATAAAAEPNRPASAPRSILRRWAKAASTTAKTCSRVAVVAGGLSVGIGFGLQNIVNNFVAGLILLFGRSIQAGDTIQIDSIWGKVRKVNIRNTVVQTFDNATLFVPNSALISGKLVNWTHRDPTVRREITIGVAYGSNTDQVRQILLDAVAGHPHVLTTPAPAVQFTNFGESSLDFKLLFWVDNVNVAVGTTSDIRFAIDRRFREVGIDIPFPQREVRIVAGAGDPVQAAAGAGAD